MAIPSGSGTEVLKRAYKHENNGVWADLITGAANHIYTILSIIFQEQAGDDEQIRIRVDVNAAGSNEICIFGSGEVNLPANSTFVFSDKLVLTGTDKLQIYTSAGNVDIYVSYIDQDFS